VAGRRRWHQATRLAFVAFCMIVTLGGAVNHVIVAYNFWGTLFSGRDGLTEFGV
jgi:hypothetical protein